MRKILIAISMVGITASAQTFRLNSEGYFNAGGTARQMVLSVFDSSATTSLVVSGSSPLSTHSTEA